MSGFSQPISGSASSQPSPEVIRARFDLAPIALNLDTAIPGGLIVNDAATGAVVYEKTLDLGKGTCYPSVTFAGGFLFVSSDNGKTLVLRPGREYQEVAANTLEPFRGSPVFLDDRLYIRGFQNLYCLRAAATP